MDFFERWFDISPDGGTGALEVLYLIVPVAIIIAFVAFRFSRFKSRPFQR